MITSSSSSSSSQFQFFFTLPGVPVSICGFLKHPQDPRYGASPDGIGETFALEVGRHLLLLSSDMESWC